MKQIRAVVFDIDQTLSPDISWTALTRDLGASVDEELRIYEEFRTGKIGYEQAKDGVLKLWQATGNANKVFFTALFERWPLAEGAEEVVALLQKERKVCAITGSMDLYAQIVAKKLGVAHWYANTTLHWDEAGNLIDFDYELKQDEKKLDQFLAFCTSQTLNPKECAVVGDGENDVLMFEASGNGIAVGDSCPEELMRVANAATSELAALPELIDAMEADRQKVVLDI
jgi:HAD superfamily phosphoserine phosphatase-like hydrolase